MTALTPAALALSRELAVALGQGVRREGRIFSVRSRTPPYDYEHHVAYTLDGQLLCDCAAATFNLECWAAKAVREEIDMTTEMSTALVPLKLTPPAAALVPSERTLALIGRTARLALAGAIALPKELNTPEKVAAVMLYGLELGLRPMTSLRHIYIVDGRPQPSAELMAGLLYDREPDARLDIEQPFTDEECTMRIIRPRHGINATYRVTIDDIKRAKLDGRDGWLKYPKDRLRWHCTKRLLRIYAPDAINALDAAFGEVAALDDETEDAELYNEGDAPPPRPLPAAPGVKQQQEPEVGPDASELASAGVPPAAAAPPQQLPVADLTIQEWWALTRRAGLDRKDVYAHCRQLFGEEKEPLQLTAPELKRLSEALGLGDK